MKNVLYSTVSWTCAAIVPSLALSSNTGRRSCKFGYKDNLCSQAWGTIPSRLSQNTTVNICFNVSLKYFDDMTHSLTTWPDKTRFYVSLISSRPTDIRSCGISFELNNEPVKNLWHLIRSQFLKTEQSGTRLSASHLRFIALIAWMSNVLCRQISLGS